MWTRWPHQARDYPGFCNMKWLGIFLLPAEWDASPFQGYPSIKFAGIHFVNLGGERHCESKVLPRACTWITQSGVERTNPEATAPLCACSVTIIINIIWHVIIERNSSQCTKIIMYLWVLCQTSVGLGMDAQLEDQTWLFVIKLFHTSLLLPKIKWKLKGKLHVKSCKEKLWK